MRGTVVLFGLIAALSAASPARAEIINLSCDDGGMLLVIDTEHLTVTDKNPFRQTQVTAPLTVTADAFMWREGSGGDAADYRMDRFTRIVRATAQGAAISLSNPQCGKSAVLIPKS
jgi:hypothetical protein